MGLITFLIIRLPLSLSRPEAPRTEFSNTSRVKYRKYYHPQPSSLGQNFQINDPTGVRMMQRGHTLLIPFASHTQKCKQQYHTDITGSQNTINIWGASMLQKCLRVDKCHLLSEASPGHRAKAPSSSPTLTSTIPLPASFLSLALITFSHTTYFTNLLCFLTSITATEGQKSCLSNIVKEQMDNKCDAFREVLPGNKCSVRVIVVITIIINRQVLLRAQSDDSCLVRVSVPHPSAAFVFVLTALFSLFSAPFFLSPSLSSVGSNALCLPTIAEVIADPQFLNSVCKWVSGGQWERGCLENEEAPARVKGESPPTSPSLLYCHVHRAI